MADLVITAASVVPGADAAFEQHIAAVAVIAGQQVYLEAATTKCKLHDADSATAEARVIRGTACHSCAAGQPLTIQRGGKIAIGATVVAGTPYFGSATAGGICPAADIATGMYPTFIGFGVSATEIQLNYVPAGVAKP
jgi:hypothetical protein